MSRADSTITSPPNWRMPTSNDTRVRVRRLLEDQRQRLAGERPRRDAAALVVGRDIQHLAQRRRLEVAQVEEVARAGHLPVGLAVGSLAP